MAALEATLEQMGTGKGDRKGDGAGKRKKATASR